MVIQKALGLAFIGLSLLTSSGCGKISGGQFYAQAGVSQGQNFETQLLSAEGQELLRNSLGLSQLADFESNGLSSIRTEAAELYESCSGSLVWIRDGKPTQQARITIQYLKNATLEGLRPEDYGGPLWDQRLARLDQTPGISESELVKFDLTLTFSAMQYVSDLHVGRVNPNQVHFALNLDHKRFDLSEFFRQRVVRAPDPGAAFESVEPSFPIYGRTKEALKKYSELARRDEGGLPPIPTRPVKPGNAYSGLPTLAKRLAILGDLPESGYQAYDEAKYQNYEGTLVEGVKHFQRRHGLDATGILDAQTIRELNVPLSRRVTQIELAMERMRWVNEKFEQPPVVVNIPEFRLYVLNEEYRSVFSMKVVVGKTYRHKTPVFDDVIRSVIFRPYWNVPESILRAELIPHLEKDPAYFSKNDYQIVDKRGRVISEGDATPEMDEQLRGGTLSVRQIPGPKDALGLIKFDFPNPYDVYMHGTPASELFSRSRRDFSHGCIRVEDPVALAKWLLRDKPEWSEEKIRAEMNGDRTFRVKLTKPVPVLIFYSTVVVLDDRIVRFFDDIYGYDASLEQALAAGAREDSEVQVK